MGKKKQQGDRGELSPATEKEDWGKIISFPSESITQSLLVSRTLHKQVFTLPHTKPVTHVVRDHTGFFFFLVTTAGFASCLESQKWSVE